MRCAQEPLKNKTRRAAMRLNSFDPETGEFSAIAATENPVLRSDYFDGDYHEVLSLASRAVRLGRIAGGRAPILDSHRMGSSRDQLGVITGARIENKQLIIEGRLSARDDVKPVAADIAAGVIRNVSVGYLVHASAEAKGPGGSRVITRTDWEPMEVSIVPAGADPQAHIRSAKGTPMSKQSSARPVVRAVTLPAHVTNPNEDDVSTADDADFDADLDDEDHTVRTRNARAVQIRPVMSKQHVRAARQSAVAFGLSEDFANRCIADGMTLDQVRIAAQDEAASAGAPRQNPHFRTYVAAADDPNSIENAVAAALYGRMTGKAPDGRGRELMGRTMLEMGTMLLEERGERVSWTNRERLVSLIMSRSADLHSTSDFPSLLMQSGNRVMLDAYKAAETPLKAIARRRDATDFRVMSSVKLSEAPKLLEVPESAEVKYGSRGEAKESFRIKTFARIYGLTRQAIINDDLSPFADTASAWDVLQRRLRPNNL